MPIGLRSWIRGNLWHSIRPIDCGRVSAGMQWSSRVTTPMFWPPISWLTFRCRQDKLMTRYTSMCQTATIGSRDSCNVIQTAFVRLRFVSRRWKMSSSRRQASRFILRNHRNLPERNIMPTRPWLAAATLCQREIIRFVRQRNRVIGALGQPILFWLLFGTGLRQTFHIPGAAAEGSTTFLEYYFPGTLVLILLFTAIFATISIIEDRKEGFLQSVLVAPIPRWAMVLGKIAGGTLLAVGQSLLFLLVAFFIGIRLDAVTLLLLVGMLTLSGIGLTALGFVLAWRMESTQGFHAIMNLLLMPLWLLSGAFFPVPTLTADAPIGSMHFTGACD